MTRAEIAKLLSLAIANFPSYQHRDMGPTLLLWETILADLTYDVAEAALTKVLATAKFWPTVADIREAAAQIQNPRVMDASEAWGQVMTALRRFGLYQTREAMKWMHPDVVAMVRRFGWYELCHAENIGVIRGQFMRAWDAHAAGQREMAVLPGRIRDLIQGTADRKALPRDRRNVIALERRADG